MEVPSLSGLTRARGGSSLVTRPSSGVSISEDTVEQVLAKGRFAGDGWGGGRKLRSTFECPREDSNLRHPSGTVGTRSP